MIANSGEYRKKNGQRGCVMMNNFIFENKTNYYVFQIVCDYQ